MKILITGTRGFLGSHLAKHWASKHELFCIPSRKNFNESLQKAINLGPWDITLHAGFEIDFTYVSNIDLQSENIKNTELLLQSQKRLGSSRFIFIGAAGVFGVSEKPLERNEKDFAQTDKKFSSYMQTRYIQEKIYLEKKLEQSETPYTSLCPSTIYDPGMDLFVRESLRKKSLIKILPPGGTSLLALSDFLAACDTALLSGPQGRLLLNGLNTSFAELYKVLSRTKHIFTLPPGSFPLIKILSSNQKNAAILTSSFGFKYYNTHKVQKCLGWQPKVSLADMTF